MFSVASQTVDHYLLLSVHGQLKRAECLLLVTVQHVLQLIVLLAHPAILFQGIFVQKQASQAGFAMFRSLLPSLVCEILPVCINQPLH